MLYSFQDVKIIIENSTGLLPMRTPHAQNIARKRNLSISSSGQWSGLTELGAGLAGLSPVRTGQYAGRAGLWPGHAGLGTGLAGLRPGHAGLGTGPAGLWPGHAGLGAGRTGLRPGHAGLEPGGPVGTGQGTGL